MTVQELIEWVAVFEDQDVAVQIAQVAQNGEIAWRRDVTICPFDPERHAGYRLLLLGASSHRALAIIDLDDA